MGYFTKNRWDLDVCLRMRSTTQQMAMMNREDDDEVWDFWVPCCTGKLISHDNGLMASMVGTLRIPWVMALVEDDPSTYDGSSALLHLECTVASHVLLCVHVLFVFYLCTFVTYVCWLHSCVQSC